MAGSLTRVWQVEDNGSNFGPDIYHSNAAQLLPDVS